MSKIKQTGTAKAQSQESEVLDPVWRTFSLRSCAVVRSRSPRCGDCLCWKLIDENDKREQQYRDGICRRDPPVSDGVSRPVMRAQDCCFIGFIPREEPNDDGQ